MTNRRNARDRVFRDHGTDPINDVHADGEDQVVNLSATPGDPGMSRTDQAVAFESARAGRRISTTSAPRPGEHLSPSAGHRRQVEINAETGETLDTRSALGLMRAAQYEGLRKHAEQNDRSATGYIRHVFGLNLPGRDRAQV